MAPLNGFMMNGDPQWDQYYEKAMQTAEDLWEHSSEERILVDTERKWNRVLYLSNHDEPPLAEEGDGTLFT